MGASGIVTKVRRWVTSLPTPRPQVGRQRLVFDPSSTPLVYIVGDLHGCLDLLVEAEEKIEIDAQRFDLPVLLVALGDLVDRGRQSSQVIERFLSRPQGGFRRISLCGNHDDAFLAFLRDPRRHLQWLDYGGAETLFSYGIDAKYMLTDGGGIDRFIETVQSAVPARHIEFLESLPVSISLGDFFLVHAGIVPGRPIDEQRDEDLLWMREPFLEGRPRTSRLPLYTVTHRLRAPVFANGRIGIDTGAYATNRLTVLRLFEGQAEVLPSA